MGETKELFEELSEALRPETLNNMNEECIKCGQESEEMTRLGNYDQESEPYCPECFMDTFYGTKFNDELADRYRD